MRRGPTVAALTCGLGLALGTAACGSSGGTAGSTAKAPGVITGGTLTQLIPSDPGNLDPLTTVTSVTRGLDTYAYDSLINQEPSGKLVSGLATSWQQSGNVYTFTLRRGVMCSDGSTLSPATVAANINFLSNPSNKSPLLNLFIPPAP